MQLSAPSPFPETILPAASGEIASDVAPDGEAPADFAALFAGLTAPAQKPTPPANSPTTPKLKTPLDDAGLLAAFVTVPTVELTPSPLPSTILPADSLEQTEQTEGEEGGESLPGFLPNSEPLATRQGATPAVPADPALASRSISVASAPGERVATRVLGETFGAPAAPAAATPSTPVSPQPAPPPVASEAPSATPAQPPTAAAEARLLATAGPGVEDAARPPRAGSTRRNEAWGEKVATGAAKFAAEGMRIEKASAALNSVEEKNFLNVGDKLVTKSDQGLGTGVALREPVMTTSAPTAPSPVFAPVGLGPKEGGIEFGTMGALDAKVTVPEPIERMAHRAVEAVAATIERGASQPAHSVNLRFSVQGADLMVRVALRSEEVQVTFRTESSDLRNALAQEWQLVRSRDPEGVLHAVTPVFTAGDAGTSTSQGGREGGGSFAQLQSQADAHSQRQSSRQPAPAAPLASPGAATGHGASAAPAARTLSSELTGAARLLHTFA